MTARSVTRISFATLTLVAGAALGCGESKPLVLRNLVPLGAEVVYEGNLGSPELTQISFRSAQKFPALALHPEHVLQRLGREWRACTGASINKWDGFFDASAQGQYVHQHVSYFRRMDQLVSVAARYKSTCNDVQRGSCAASPATDEQIVTILLNTSTNSKLDEFLSATGVICN